MVAFTDEDYTVRLTATPGEKVAGILDADGNTVLTVVREGLWGDTWFAFRDPDGTPVFHVRTTARSVGPFAYTTRRYPIVDAGTEEPVAELVKRWSGPFGRRFDVESPTGSRLATVAGRSRMWSFLRGPPFSWIPVLWPVVPPPTYDVTTPSGTRIAVMRKRERVVGVEFEVRLPYDVDFPWIAVFAVVVLGGRAGTARRPPDPPS